MAFFEEESCLAPAAIIPPGPERVRHRHPSMRIIFIVIARLSTPQLAQILCSPNK
jgi:hypothetical protein